MKLLTHRVPESIQKCFCRRFLEDKRVYCRVKSFLARAVVNIARRGESRGHRFAWWSRWFPPDTTVDPDRFQGEDDPYPDHWKRFPEPWPEIPASEETGRPGSWWAPQHRSGSKQRWRSCRSPGGGSWSCAMSKARPQSRWPTRSG